MLLAFQRMMTRYDAEREQGRRKEKERERRQERKNREGFVVSECSSFFVEMTSHCSCTHTHTHTKTKALLDEFRDAGRLHAQSLWRSLYPDFLKDIRYTAMLGQQGSSPLDLFKLCVDNLKEELYRDRKIVKEVLKVRTSHTHNLSLSSHKHTISLFATGKRLQHDRRHHSRTVHGRIAGWCRCFRSVIHTHTRTITHSHTLSPSLIRTRRKYVTLLASI